MGTSFLHIKFIGWRSACDTPVADTRRRRDLAANGRSSIDRADLVSHSILGRLCRWRGSSVSVSGGCRARLNYLQGAKGARRFDLDLVGTRDCLRKMRKD